MSLPLALQMPGLTEWIIIGALGLLFFGKRLPEVGRSLGKGIVEFKKGLKGIEEDLEAASSQPSGRPPQAPPPQQQTAYKFDPYTGKPIDPNATPPNAG
ncbi:MAG TPA: twin-arginine translocase TatA/TatE family subunit [Tepidisphaeraceae bacterium]|jgi:sec-independent protein translocase protein TatA